MSSFKFVHFKIHSYTSARNTYTDNNFFAQRYNLHQWQSEAHATFPQEIVIEFEERCQLAQAVIQALPECSPTTNVAIQVYDQGEWRECGAVKQLSYEE